MWLCASEAQIHSKEDTEMTTYREILRLNSRGISQWSIAVSCQCSRNTITRILERAKEVNVAWPIQSDLTNSKLEKLLFPDLLENSTTRCLPDLENIHKELAKSGVTLRLFWTQYCTTCRMVIHQNK